MNYFDKEIHILQMFQDEEYSDIFFPFESEQAERIFHCIHDSEKWKQWKDNSAKGAPPPDFYCDAFKCMMEIMRIDDHAYIKHGKLINPTNQRESEIQQKLKQSGFLESFPNSDGVIVNAITDLPSDEDHNYQRYKENFTRELNKHKSKIPQYKKNHPGYQLVFFVLDESSSYMELAGNPASIRRAPGRKHKASPHMHFFDKDFLTPVINSDIDYLIWYSPFKNTPGNPQYPHATIIDIKEMSKNKDKLIHYLAEKMLSVEL